MKKVYQVYSSDFKRRGEIEADSLKMAIVIAKETTVAPIVKSSDGKEEDGLLKRTNRWAEA